MNQSHDESLVKMCVLYTLFFLVGIGIVMISVILLGEDFFNKLSELRIPTAILVAMIFFIVFFSSKRVNNWFEDRLLNEKFLSATVFGLIGFVVVYFPLTRILGPFDNMALLVFLSSLAMIIALLTILSNHDKN
ncbi:hypothetical protein HQ533_01255 [Candidatus Woesearchaeota archaeon]|nr:hypothetical protein [Candidatus Woesearchaeota archaeon]